LEKPFTVELFSSKTGLIKRRKFFLTAFVMYFIDAEDHAMQREGIGIWKNYELLMA
jgi:hypothetical protein